MLTRRSFLVLGPLAAIGAYQATRGGGDGVLGARVKAPTIKTAPGEYPLGLGGDRDGVLIVPKPYRHDAPAPLAVMLHGAGGRARRVSALFAAAADLGIILLVPESRGGTWDAIRGGYGPDVTFLDLALKHTFDRCAVDRRRLAIGGFSDGATYGLSVGLINGDVFTHVLACSPGFIIPGGTVQGKPRIYMSHGTADEILPIDATSRRIHPQLRRAGYTVKYTEFNGPHGVPPEIAREALTWFKGE
jgi:phospholipase/carboxylesterase